MYCESSAKFPINYSGHCVVTDGRLIVLFGGENGKNFSNKTFVFNTEEMIFGSFIFPVTVGNYWKPLELHRKKDLEVNVLYIKTQFFFSADIAEKKDQNTLMNYTSLTSLANHGLK
eukprot:GHVL01001627.1.p1 GENE.GHVL01001627.1~~GHVL01001627.1.p1  ORF type:complete len:116 (+),score=13.71 GHVL01001627.1:46-393(+)